MNLSLHGCGINGAPPCSCGTRLRLALCLPDQTQLWVNDDQFGVSFLDVPPDTRARLVQVFHLLHEVQQPEVTVIPKSAFAHYAGASP
jgi:hypothetical protein